LQKTLQLVLTGAARCGAEFDNLGPEIRADRAGKPACRNLAFPSRSQIDGVSGEFAREPAQIGRHRLAQSAFGLDPTAPTASRQKGIRILERPTDSDVAFSQIDKILAESFRKLSPFG
jgi:hypothetical protein